MTEHLNFCNPQSEFATIICFIKLFPPFQVKGTFEELAKERHLFKPLAPDLQGPQELSIMSWNNIIPALLHIAGQI